MAASGSNSLEKVYASLSLSVEDEEELVVVDKDVKEPDEDDKFVLVGRLATTKPVKFHFLRDTMASIWRPGRGVCISEIATNLYVFKFYHEVDVKRVLEDGPWSYENNMLILKLLGPSENPQEVALNMAEMWVQAHNLPSNYVTENVAAAIGSTLGIFIKAHKKNFEGPWRSFMRIRVQLDITKPLRRRLKMKKAGGEPFWVDFKYERLANFCFLCGVIGHTEKFCHLLFDGVDEETERPFGSWLRASGRRPALNVGGQWLITDVNQKERTKPDCPGEGERVGSVSSTEIRYEVHGRQNTLEASAQKISVQSIPVTNQSSGKISETNVYKVLGQYNLSGPDSTSGQSKTDQKRKRAEDLSTMDLNTENMEEDNVVEFGSKKISEVGFAGHAHLEQ